MPKTLLKSIQKQFQIHSQTSPRKSILSHWSPALTIIDWIVATTTTIIKSLQANRLVYYLLY